MGFQIYVLRILFVVLVAVAFNYREQIMETVSKVMGNRETTPTPSKSVDKILREDGPLQPKDPDYYNPPFDPENPPDPLYSKSGVRLITLNELAAHGADGPLTPIWLAIMGKVFNVDKGAEHYYGPDGGYKFFSGIEIESPNLVKGLYDVVLCINFRSRWLQGIYYR